MENETRRERERKIHVSEIIQAAENLFRQQGYENTSMDDIARASQFTKRTLYQYFASKDDLYFAVLQKGMAKFHSYLAIDMEQTLSGYERVRQIMLACFRFYQDYPEFFKLLNYIGYARQNLTGAEEDRQSFFVVNNALFQGMAALIASGQMDGSIPADMDAEKTSMSLLFVMTGFFNQLSGTGKNFSKHFNLDEQEFSAYTLDLILRVLKKNA